MTSEMHTIPREEAPEELARLVDGVNRLMEGKTMEMVMSSLFTVLHYAISSTECGTAKEEIMEAYIAFMNGLITESGKKDKH